MLFAFLLVMAGSNAPFAGKDKKRKKTNDTTALADTLGPDTLLSQIAGIKHDSLQAAGPDTTKMDSMALAIFRHNKHIDDSIRLDSMNKAKSTGIESPVKFAAADSMVYNAKNKYAFLYGNSSVVYQNMDLKSADIKMNMDSSLVHATGAKDSTGALQGRPVFKMGDTQYDSDTIAFNFKTKKGFINNVYTEQEDGFLTSLRSKRNDKGELFLEHGRYTTCDAEHPDFYIALSRAKVRPGKDVVFGPA